MCFYSYVKDGDFERGFPSWCNALQRHMELLDSEDYEVCLVSSDRRGPLNQRCNWSRFCCTARLTSVLREVNAEMDQLLANLTT